VFAVLAALAVAAVDAPAQAKGRDYVASAKRAVKRWNAYRSCFDLRARHPKITDENARAVWKDARRRIVRLRHRMTHPRWQRLGAQAWRPLVRWCFRRQGIGWRAEQAIVIIRRESGGNPYCRTGSHFGLFQFNASLWGVSPATACDPWWNVNRAARAVREQGGWYPAWAATAP